MKSYLSIICLFFLLNGCATSPPAERDASVVDTPYHLASQDITHYKDVPERWDFTFDSSARPSTWQLGYQAADGKVELREYVLPGETVYNWRKLITSMYLKVDLAPKEYFQGFIENGAMGCPSLEFSVVEETQNTLIYKLGNNGCHGHPPQHEIGRISRTKSGIVWLKFSEKGPLSALTVETYNTWLSILRNAVVRRSLPLSALGPLPPNESSEYIESRSGILFNIQNLVGQFHITLKAKPKLPSGAYLVAHFENPANPDNPIVVGKVRQGSEEEVLILSPELKGIKCWNYEIVVYVYQDSSKSKLLGTHHQGIQSRVNLDKVKTAEDLLDAASSGNCP